MTESADFRPETLVALEAVKRALTIARRGVGAADVTAKDGRDIVTGADFAVEDAVRSIVAGALGFSVVGEERGGEAPADGAPLYCVNLALVERNEVTVAVVGDPSTGETHVAERGRGAWSLKEGARVRLTASAQSRTIVVEDGKSKGNRREQAAGRIAAYVVFWVSAIHAGAGSLLVTEAGGTVSDLDGRPWTIGSDSLVASANRRLQEELLNLVRATLNPQATQRHRA